MCTVHDIIHRAWRLPSDFPGCGMKHLSCAQYLLLCRGCEVVELAVADSRDERRDLRAGVDERRARRVTRVAHRDLPALQRCDFDAVSAGVAGLALAPRGHAKLVRRNTVRVLHPSLP